MANETNLDQFHPPLPAETLAQVDRFIFPAINKVRKELAPHAENSSCEDELVLILNAAQAVPSLAKEVRKARAAAISLTEREEGATPLADTELAELVALYQQLSPKPLLALDPHPETGEVIILEETRRNVVTWLCTMASQSGNMEGWAKLFASSINALPGLLARLAASPASVSSPQNLPEIAGYHSTELSDISSIITWLHAQNKPMGELVRRFYNDATRGKLIKEYNDAAPLPAAATPLGVVEPAGAASPTRKGSSEWVPVGERLPDHDGPVLILAYSDAKRTPIWRTVHVAVMAQFGWNDYHNEDEAWGEDEVTHWQPLPTPPQP